VELRAWAVEVALVERQQAAARDTRGGKLRPVGAGGGRACGAGRSAALWEGRGRIRASREITLSLSAAFARSSGPGSIAAGDGDLGVRASLVGKKTKTNRTIDRSMKDDLQTISSVAGVQFTRS
jgi:hypothetical protein